MVNGNAGKGSLYRPVNKVKYDANFDKIFRAINKYYPKGCSYYSKREKKMVTVPKGKKG